MKCLVLSGICALGPACSTPVNYGSPITKDKPLPPLPIFVMDSRDAERHPIEAVCVGCIEGDTEDSEVTEITVVFADESPSFFGVQTLFLSEPLRRLIYGRWQDVESFRYSHEGEAPDSGIQSIIFDGTFACCQAYRAPWPSHPSAVIPIDAFEHEGGRPVIYVTTWNHLFHWEPRDLSKRRVRKIGDYQVYEGVREVVDGLW